MFLSVLRYTNFCKKAWAKGEKMAGKDAVDVLKENCIFYMHEKTAMFLYPQKEEVCFIFASLEHGDLSILYYRSVSEALLSLPLNLSVFKFLSLGEFAKMSNSQFITEEIGTC